jgi:hypothetical protein
MLYEAWNLDTDQTGEMRNAYNIVVGRIEGRNHFGDRGVR